MRGRVLVRLRGEVLDPQGTTVAQALDNLGYSEVVDVRQGKVFEIELDVDDADTARERLAEMAGKLLANPVIEEYTVTVEGDESPERRSGDERRADERRTAERREEDRRAGESTAGEQSDQERRESRRRNGERRAGERRSDEERRADESAGDTTAAGAAG